MSQTVEIEALVKSLSDHGGDKAADIEACVRHGGAAVPPLLRALRARPTQHLVQALGLIADARATGPLIALLYRDVCRPDGAGNLAGEAAEALGRIGDARAVRPLLAALEQGHATTTRAALARALARMDVAEAQPTLERWVDESGKDDPSPYVSAWLGRVAQEALERLRTKTLAGGELQAQRRQELLRELASDDVRQRLAACEAAGLLGDPWLAAALVETLAQYPYLQYVERGEFVSSREAAACALGRLAVAETVPHLREALGWEDELLPGARVGRGLEHSGTEFARAVLAQGPTGPGYLRERLAQRAPELIAQLGDHSVSSGLRQEACCGLAMAGSPLAVGPLLRALGDSDLEVRARAAYALGALGERSALPRLRRLEEEAQRMPERYPGPAGITVDQSAAVRLLRREVGAAVVKLGRAGPQPAGATPLTQPVTPVPATGQDQHPRPGKKWWQFWK